MSMHHRPKIPATLWCSRSVVEKKNPSKPHVFFFFLLLFFRIWFEVRRPYSIELVPETKNSGLNLNNRSLDFCAGAVAIGRWKSLLSVRHSSSLLVVFYVHFPRLHKITWFQCGAVWEIVIILWIKIKINRNGWGENITQDASVAPAASRFNDARE